MEYICDLAMAIAGSRNILRVLLVVVADPKRRREIDVGVQEQMPGGRRHESVCL